MLHYNTGIIVIIFICITIIIIIIEVHTQLEDIEFKTKSALELVLFT